MTKTVKINENYSLSYNSREDQSGDTVADIDIRFDNPKDLSIIADRLNRWLTAIGVDLEVVVKGKK
jgi:hypothetical protein